MTDQPNPYSQPEEGSGVPVGEAKTSKSKQGIWFWVFMGCIVPLALVGLATIALIIYVYYEAMYSGI